MRENRIVEVPQRGYVTLRWNTTIKRFVTNSIGDWEMLRMLRLRDYVHKDKVDDLLKSLSESEYELGLETIGGYKVGD